MSLIKLNILFWTLYPDEQLVMVQRKIRSLIFLNSENN